MRRFLDSEASGGIVLMGVTVVALVVANSPLAGFYFGILNTYVLGLSVLHWINDGLMAVFFLLVGLEIKREMLDGQLATWPRRALPGIAALGGMVVPALIYLAFNARRRRTRARLGDPDGDRHRLRARRARAARQARADLAEDLPDRARDHRRSRRRSSSSRCSTPAISRSRCSAAASRLHRGSDRAQPLRASRGSAALSRARRAAVVLRPAIRHPRHARRRRAGADRSRFSRARENPAPRTSPLHRLEHALMPGWPSRSFRSSALPMRAFRLRACRRRSC